MLVHQRGAGVSKIMEATMLKTALFQNPREYRFNIARSYDIPYLVEKDIVEPILVVGVPAELAVFLLLCFQCQQSAFHTLRSRKCAAACFVLCAVGGMKLGVAFDVHFSQRVVDGQQIILKINRSPSQSQDRTSSQTVHRRNENDKSHAVVLCRVKELLQLAGGKGFAPQGHDLRRIDLLHGIVHDQVHAVSVGMRTKSWTGKVKNGKKIYGRRKRKGNQTI